MKMEEVVTGPSTARVHSSWARVSILPPDFQLLCPLFLTSVPCSAWSWKSFPSWQRSWRQGTFAGWYTPAGEWHSAGRPGDGRGNRQSTGRLSGCSLWPREALRVAGRRLWGQDWSDRGRWAWWKGVEELEAQLHILPPPIHPQLCCPSLLTCCCSPIGPCFAPDWRSGSDKRRRCWAFGGREQIASG